MDGACSTYGGRRGEYSVLLGRSEGKRQLGRHKHRREDNIKIYLKETGWDGVVWIHYYEPSESTKCKYFLD
jgi:hypothetical protein